MQGKDSPMEHTMSGGTFMLQGQVMSVPHLAPACLKGLFWWAVRTNSLKTDIPFDPVFLILWAYPKAS